jgi:hypothetical protein
VSLPFLSKSEEGDKWRIKKGEDDREARLTREVLQVLPRCCGGYVFAVCCAADYGACGG